MIGMLKGLQATISHLFTKKVTVQYPEERRELPQRSRGLIRLRLKENLEESRCISCTFCEQVCPAIAINVIYRDKQPEKVWTFDAGAGPMLARLLPGDKAVGMEPWPGDEAKAAPDRDGCLAASFVDAEMLTPMVIAKAARKNGVWLSQAFGIATFYDQLGPGAPEPGEEAPLPEIYGAVAGCPPVITGGFGSVNPESIDSYKEAGGYQAPERGLTEMNPAEVIDEIAISGLRGRGGSGFSTGKKWKLVQEADAWQKYVICNACESDPGSFKDRAILEMNPHSIVEGMIIAGYAVGASKGYICLSASSRTAAERVRLAVQQAEEHGFLGEKLPGTEFAFHIKVMTLPEAFAAGEETMLISTLEGKRPQARVRPPYPSEKGLFGRPTLVENVETLANIPWIMKNGAREYQQIGSPSAGAPGTKLFTLHGAVAKPGIYEAPLDTTLKKLVESEAGGFTSEPKAALVGSVGGGFLSPGLFDIPLDFDSLREAGGDLSSGVIEVLGAGDCVVDKVRSCLGFSSPQACGKCVPDRLGTKRLLDIIERICAGDGREGDLELARDLADDVAAGSLCGLGRGAVKPLLTALHFFHSEFEEHAVQGRCSAGKCQINSRG